MECSLCYEEFNRSERLPKVLKHCGHTFCDTCVGAMIKMSRLKCPYNCFDMHLSLDDYPVNNYALLQAMDEIDNEREGKGVSKYYKPRYHVSTSTVNNDNPMCEDIFEFINRTNTPHFLRLNSITDNGEILYQ